MSALSADAQNAQFRRVSNEMGMIVFASQQCGFALSDDFQSGLRTMETGNWTDVFKAEFGAGKKSGAAASALAGQDAYCSATCIAHGPKVQGGSGAFVACN